MIALFVQTLLLMGAAYFLGAALASSKTIEPAFARFPRLSSQALALARTLASAVACFGTDAGGGAAASGLLAAGGGASAGGVAIVSILLGAAASAAFGSGGGAKGAGGSGAGGGGGGGSLALM